MIHQLREQGLSISAIAQRMGLDRKTVRKYLNESVAAPSYGPRAPRARLIDPYVDYLRERLKQCPQLSAMRLLREVKGQGYTGGRTSVTEFVAAVRPREARGFEHRFETAPGRQGQVDFAQFKTVFRDEPDRVQVVWLFSMVLGFSRYLFGRFAYRQTLDTVVRCHLEAFSEFGGVPLEVLYDRMKTAVVGEDDDGAVRYHPTLLDVGAHFGFRPQACAPYRAKTKGKVERPFRYVREDFFLGTEFDNLADLNAKFDRWRSTVANCREHGTTRRHIHDAFAEEQLTLQPLSTRPYTTVLRLERRLTRDGMVSVEGNLYSVPDHLTEPVVEVHRLADAVHIYDAGQCVAVHPLLDGRGLRSLLDGHRQWPPPGTNQRRTYQELAQLEALAVPGQRLAERPLAVYAQLGKVLADEPVERITLETSR